MTIEKAHELISMHVGLGSGYNRNAARMVLGEVMRDFGQDVVDQLIREYSLEEKWEIKPGTHFESAFKK
jgi:uncharacterized lipoprotein YddW (UPF0748 family)